MYKIILCAVVAIPLFSCTEHTKTTTVKFTDKSIKDSIIPLTKADILKKDTVVISKIVNDSILPGKSIGDIYIDETSEEVLVKLGKPDSSEAGMNKILLTWFSKPTMKNEDTIVNKLAIFATNKTQQSDGKYWVKKIRITSPLFKTAEKVGCGSTLAYIKLQYPILKKSVSEFTDEQGNDIELYDDVKDGIAFEICNNKCKAILVHASRKKTI